MPTQDAGTIRLIDAPDAVEAVLEVAKSFDMTVASTHASFADTEMLARLARSVVLERFVVTNPVSRFGADEGSQLLSHDLYVELPFLSYYDGQDAGERLRADNREDRGGPVHRVYGLRAVDEPLRLQRGCGMAIAAMLDAGMGEGNIGKVVRTNPP